jgi:hypothetical protein
MKDLKLFFLFICDDGKEDFAPRPTCLPLSWVLSVGERRGERSVRDTDVSLYCKLLHLLHLSSDMFEDLWVEVPPCLQTVQLLSDERL